MFDIPYVPRPEEGNPFHILNDGVMSIHATLAQTQPFIISLNGCGRRCRLSLSPRHDVLLGHKVDCLGT